jgi:hypothetical protein
MTTTDQKPRKAWTLGHVGIGQQSPYKRKEKSASLCDEEGCDKPITHWLKFNSGRMGFYCNEHKELFEKWGILARIESAQREQEAGEDEPTNA